MPGPPPPPPGPPPPPTSLPPMTKFTPAAKSSSGGGDNRNALLSQIQKGAKLKKTVTVDKSGPAIAGKVSGAADSSSMSRGARGAPALSVSAKTSPDSATSSPSRPVGGFANLTEELQYKMTLKKNKNSPVKEVRNETSDIKEIPTKTSPASGGSLFDELKSRQLNSSSNSAAASLHKSSTDISSSPASSTLSSATPNSSSLFNRNPTVLNPPKIINHGKPNLAPKPPPQLKLATSNNSVNTENNENLKNGDNNRKAVARHQSMRTPKSPPITMTNVNSENHFGTMRLNTSNQLKLQDALNLQTPIQKPSMAPRPTNKPPPPPVPNRAQGTNLTNNHHAKSTNALNLSSLSSSNDNGLSAPRRLPSSGSSNNISHLTSPADQADSAAPPLPPHRISSQSHPLKSHHQQQQLLPPPPPPQVITASHPPEVPRRNSSMRSSIEVSANNGKHSSVSSSVTSMVVDLEGRYSFMFHKSSEFPLPRPYLNVAKSYPSKVSVTRPQNGI